MPVRDVEACFPQSPKRLRFLANRGANGIDGVVSSATGAALAAGGPAWLLTGELALLHDVGGLLAARRAEADLQVVCINNGGGAIFDFLPVAEHADPELYEDWHVTCAVSRPSRFCTVSVQPPHAAGGLGRFKVAARANGGWERIAALTSTSTFGTV